MKRPLIATITLIVAFGLAATAIAQRHDEKPQGVTAKATDARNAEVVSPSAWGGRHDERPHGTTKKAAPAKVPAKPGGTAPAAAPVAGPAAVPETTKPAN